MTEHGQKFRFSWEMVATLVVWLVSAVLAYGAISGRVAVVESQMESFRDDMHELRADVKELLRRAQ